MAKYFGGSKKFWVQQKYLGGGQNFGRQQNIWGGGFGEQNIWGPGVWQNLGEGQKKIGGGEAKHFFEVDGAAYLSDVLLTHIRYSINTREINTRCKMTSHHSDILHSLIF